MPSKHTSPTQLPPHPKSDEFDVLPPIRDPDGVSAQITIRKKDGRASFSLFTEFEKDGRTQRSNYLKPAHLAGVRRLLDDLSERLPIEETRARAKLRG